MVFSENCLKYRVDCGSPGSRDVMEKKKKSGIFLHIQKGTTWLSISLGGIFILKNNL